MISAVEVIVVIAIVVIVIVVIVIVVIVIVVIVIVVIVVPFVIILTFSFFPIFLSIFLLISWEVFVFCPFFICRLVFIFLFMLLYNRLWWLLCYRWLLYYRWWLLYYRWCLLCDGWCMGRRPELGDEGVKQLFELSDCVAILLDFPFHRV